MNDEIEALKLSKEKAEANVSELKDKLREEILKSQQAKNPENSHRSNARERY